MESKLHRSKSLSSLTSEEFPIPIHKISSCYNDKLFYGESSSNSSVEVYVVNDSECDEEQAGVDSGMEPGWWHSEITVLEHKLDKLSDLFQEQCELLSVIKEEVGLHKYWELSELQFNSCTQIKALENTPSAKIKEEADKASIDCEGDTRGRNLLEAIESSPINSLDRAVRDALTECLNSKELQEQLVTKTTAVVRESVSSWVSRDLSARCVPEMERHSRRLMRNVTNMFNRVLTDLNKATSAKHDNRSVNNIRRALHRHRQRLEEETSTLRNELASTIETILKQELVDWRQKVLNLFGIPTPPPAPTHIPSPPVDEYVPSSPPQPADPKVSIIDQLLESAMITKHISDGDINASFARALSASDLSLVMCACRAADPELVFSKPCKLEPEVMLSLMQQLATDMVHDTQLKCLYLESCITSFDPASICARAHLPSVATSVSQHLSRFLAAYPAHLAARRVTIILMAIGHLTK